MTTFLLVRHCAVGALGHYLAGRAPDEHLTTIGCDQARDLAHQFRGVSLDAVFSSPLERARETAEAFATCAASGVQLADELLEVDFGEWTGKSFGELAHDPRWQRFNAHRTTVRIPGGETLLEVQVRGVGFMQRIADELPDGRVAVVSHGDVLRGIVCYYLGLALDLMQHFEIAPGGLSVLEHRPEWTVLRTLNAARLDAQVLLGAS